EGKLDRVVDSQRRRIRLRGQWRGIRQPDDNGGAQGDHRSESEGTALTHRPSSNADVRRKAMLPGGRGADTDFSIRYARGRKPPIKRIRSVTRWGSERQH